MKTNKDCLWVNILRNKYLRHHSIDSWPKDCVASHTWRGIKNTHKFIQQGTKWKIGNGNDIDLWKDWWCGDCPLASKFPGHHVNLGMKV